MLRPFPPTPPSPLGAEVSGPVPRRHRRVGRSCARIGAKHKQWPSAKRKVRGKCLAPTSRSATVTIPAQTMTYNPLQNHRRSIRLKGYDYRTDAAYFVTICTHGRLCTLGEIECGRMTLSAAGQIVDNCWRDLESAIVR